ncbi:hypothetical protein Bbelb_218580 [Branchiostoma belcheri]|nr:hypothetical protein Bbelb_218580 [Branchiostoma belcheri]
MVVFRYTAAIFLVLVHLTSEATAQTKTPQGPHVTVECSSWNLEVPGSNSAMHTTVVLSSVTMDKYSVKESNPRPLDPVSADVATRSFDALARNAAGDAAATTAASASNDGGSGDGNREEVFVDDRGAAATTTSQPNTLNATTTVANNSTSQANSTNATLTTPPLTTTTPTTIQATTAAAEDASCRDKSSSFSGDSFIISCPPGCTSGNIWGTGIYTSDSRVCQAAIHDGRITEIGGRVTVYVWSGQQSYQGSTQNGITSDRTYNNLTGDYYNGTDNYNNFANQKARSDHNNTRPNHTCYNDIGQQLNITDQQYKCIFNHASFDYNNTYNLPHDYNTVRSDVCNYSAHPRNQFADKGISISINVGTGRRGRPRMVYGIPVQTRQNYKPSTTYNYKGSNDTSGNLREATTAFVLGVTTSLTECFADVLSLEVTAWLTLYFDCPTGPRFGNNSLMSSCRLVQPKKAVSDLAMKSWTCGQMYASDGHRDEQKLAGKKHYREEERGGKTSM